jgi:DAACS family dicarboxylate/amino acid:cation (Na+ or H+) symporter
MVSHTVSMQPVRRSSGSIFGISVPVQMLIGLVIGCIVGLLWPTVGKELLPLGQAFVKALRMLVIPLVFSSIALGVYNMGREIGAVGRVVGIAFVWFYLATGLCVVIGLVMNGIFHPGVGADLTIAGGKVPANAGLSVNWVEFLLDLVPANVVSAMAEQKVLQVLLFGMLLGGALSTVGEIAQPVVGVLRGVQAACGGSSRLLRWPSPA